MLPDSDIRAIASTVDRVDRYSSSYPIPVPSPCGYDTSPVSPNSPLPCAANTFPASSFGNDSDRYGHQNITLLSPSSPCIINPHTITRMPAEPSWTYQVSPPPEHEMIGEYQMYDMAEAE